MAQIVTDRPDQTESSLTVPSGAFQMESGITASFQNDSRVLSVPNFLVRYGLSEKIELRLFNQVLDFRPTSNSNRFQFIDDLQFGTKIQLMDKEESNTSIAILSHLILPTGDEFFGISKVGTMTRLCVSHKLTESIGLAYNVGYQNFATPNGDLIYSLSLSKSVNSKFGFYVEPYGLMVELEEFTLAFDTGITYQPSPNIQWDFTYGNGISDRGSFVAAGVSYVIHPDHDK
jgi:hypothetical protein